MKPITYPPIPREWRCLSVAGALLAFGLLGCVSDPPPFGPQDPDVPIEDVDPDQSGGDAGEIDVPVGADVPKFDADSIDTDEFVDSSPDVDVSTDAEPDTRAPTEDVPAICGEGECGNGVLDPGETCDPGAGPGVGACLSQCFDGLACTRDVRQGASALCSVVCTFEPVTECKLAEPDGCCPPGCSAINDADCVSTCGNGQLDPGEVCDGDCPANPQDCDDGNPCTDDVFAGSAANCSAVCSHFARPGCWNPASGCCGGFCGPGAEAACPKAVCGNGILEPGELCDGNCPTSCPSGSGCEALSLAGSPARCNAQCVPTTPCKSGDGCCPETCSLNNDGDCDSLPCLCISCEVPPNECLWNGVERRTYDGVTCATAGGNPKCNPKSFVERCAYACEGQDCVPQPCESPNGAPSIDFCGDGIDQDCDGEPRLCKNPPSMFELIHPEVAIGPDCSVSPASINLWAGAGAHPGNALSTQIRLVNNTQGVLSWSNGEEQGQVEPNAEGLAPSLAAWKNPGTLTLQRGGCADAMVGVGWIAPAESATRFEGYILPAAPGASPIPVELRVHALPIPLGGDTPQGNNPPAHLRECAGYHTCTALAEVHIKILTEPAVEFTFDPSGATKPFVTWSVVGPLLNFNFTGAAGPVTGQLKGPPNFITGTLQGLPEAFTGAAWALHIL